jgi:hypothetical protein
LRAIKSATTAALLAFGLTSVGLAADDESTADDDGTAKEFAAAIETFNARDPQSPDTLNTRLAYADFLTKLDHGDCRAQLDAARDQLDLAKASPALEVVLPAARARLAHIDYQLHSARASCGATANVRGQELHAALASAQSAVEGYRHAFDAVSMVTMQFNTSMVYRRLGDKAAAAAALQTTIDMDREYGFADDAAENYRLLLQWNQEKAGADQIAARMRDFPHRSVTLEFGWFESDADVTFQTDVTGLAGGDTVHMHASRSAQRQVRKGLVSWSVSYHVSEAHYELGELPTDELLMPQFANSLALMLMRFHDFRVTRHGDFDDGKGEFKFDSRARADAKPLARELGSSQLAHLFRSAVREAQSAEAIEARLAEDYNLEAGTWIGATLEQGVWYDMTASLSLPIAPQVYVMHKMQFTYSRPVPCTGASTEVSCVEIVLRAAPDPDILKASLERLTRKSHLAGGQVPRLWSTTTMRLVTDPKTLQPYSREMRHHAYWSSGEPGPDHALSESETTVLSDQRASP